MKNIFVLIAFLSLAVAGYSQSSTGGIFLRVNDSTTYRSSASTAALHTAGYHDIVYNNQATTPHYDVYFGPGTNDYYHVNSLGWAPTSGGGGATAAGATGNVQYKSNGGGLQAEAAFSYDSATNLLTVPSITAGSSTSLTDGAAITITGTKHNLTSTQPTVTWTLSQTGDYSTTRFTLNTTSTVWTFPAGAFCKFDGVPSNSNVVTLVGTTGSQYVMSIYKDGTDYVVLIATTKVE